MLRQCGYDLLVFDLDGVITTEHIYWECARLVIWELLHVQLRIREPYVQAVHDVSARKSILSQSFVERVKNRAVNSNWDLTFLAACAVLVALPPKTGQGSTNATALLNRIAKCRVEPVDWPSPLTHLLDASGERRGTDLLRYAGQAAAAHLDIPAELLSPDGGWWHYLFERFQSWYSGRSMGVWGAAPLQERPVLPVAVIRATLATLRNMGCLLGVATGRLYDEVCFPLQSFGIFDFFASDRVSTYDDVIKAQEVTGQGGLGKPHPFAILRACYPEASYQQLVKDDGALQGVNALMIGDSASDAIAAKAAGILCLGMLSGVAAGPARQKRREVLLAAGCVDVIDDLSSIPRWLAEH